MTNKIKNQPLIADIVAVIKLLETNIPNIARTRVGDTMVSERLGISAKLRQILRSHGVSIESEPSGDIGIKIRERVLGGIDKLEDDCSQ